MALQGDMEATQHVEHLSEEIHGGSAGDGTAGNGGGDGNKMEQPVKDDDAELEASVRAAAAANQELRVQVAREQRRSQLRQMEAENRHLEDELRLLTDASDMEVSINNKNNNKPATSHVGSKHGKKEGVVKRSRKTKVKAAEAAGRSGAIATDGATCSVDTLKNSDVLRSGADKLLQQLGFNDPLESSDSCESGSEDERQARVRKTSEYERTRRIHLENSCQPGMYSLPKQHVTHDARGFHEHAAPSGRGNINAGVGHRQGCQLQNYSASTVKNDWSQAEDPFQSVRFCKEAESDTGGVKNNNMSTEELKWPHEHLGAKYNNYGKADTKYKQLDLRLLVAGELNIMMDGGMSLGNSFYRMQLLSDVVFSAVHYQWSAVLKFHAAVLTEIQEGRMRWGESYSRLEQQMLMPYPQSKAKALPEKKVYDGKSRDAQRGYRSEGLRTAVFCADYQRNTCRYSESHQGQFFGQTTTLYHICGVCLKKDEKKENHPSSAPECPHRGEM